MGGHAGSGCLGVGEVGTKTCGVSVGRRQGDVVVDEGLSNWAGSLHPSDGCAAFMGCRGAQ